MPQSIGHTWVRHSAILLCATVGLSVAATSVSAQGNLGFLKDTPLAYFKGDDAKLMRAAAAEVLKSAQHGARKEWENPATGNGGAITLMTQFAAPDGRQCDQVRVETRAGGMENISTMSVCRGADGTWKVSAAKPPKS